MNYCPNCGVQLIENSKSPLKGEPTPLQEKFLATEGKYVGFLGGIGVGKSWAIRRKLALLALQYPNLSLLLLTETRGKRDTHVSRLIDEINDFYKFDSERNTFTFPNGSRIYFDYGNTEEDVFRLAACEFNVIGIDNTHTFSEFQIGYLKTRTRSRKQDFKPRMYFTARVDECATWFKRVFIDREYVHDENPEDYTCVRCEGTID